MKWTRWTVIAAALLAIAGCGAVHTAASSQFEQEHKNSPVTRHEAEVAFEQTFMAEKHLNEPEVSCHFEEGEWQCTADGHTGSGETSECVVEYGTVSRTGQISTGTTNSGAGALPYCAHRLPHPEGQEEGR